MGILLCEQNFRDVWIRNKSEQAEIGQILRTHTHTTAAKLVVRITILSCCSIVLVTVTPDWIVVGAFAFLLHIITD